MPPVPRPILAALYGLWWVYFVAGTIIEKAISSQGNWWLSVWSGGLGGNGFSAFGATVLSILLTSEVIYMVLTWLGNRRRVIDAANKAAKKGRMEGREVERQEWLAWYETVKEDLDTGRPPSVPPPNAANGTSDSQD